MLRCTWRNQEVTRGGWWCLLFILTTRCLKSC
ncbi:hypothetical protein Gohar_011480 [Gossypium harknessii]|uniref:Uncharacterized protein n=1 Tax=Gossypium harknessii TaxID=34285 RepID=A0A7J9GU39_9ROSI|nr:hypothetical protein [Gossypium harknessii]